MPTTKQVLFICEGNLHRSPTAEQLYSTTPGVKVLSAGLSHLAKIQITEELVNWADMIFVMEKRLRSLLRLRFRRLLKGKDLISLDIPDDYQYQQPELIQILIDRLSPYLGQPMKSEDKS